MANDNKLICIVGMCGAGKSEVSEYMLKKRKFGYFRFGQITLDKIREMGKEPNEALEREIRERLRAEHGMAAFAILNRLKIDKFLQEGDVIGDNMMSWEEYVELKAAYPDNLIVIAVFAPPKLRYERLDGRHARHGDDPHKRYRSFTKTEAATRDKSEIENLHKAGPLAMADYVVINTSTIKELEKQVDAVMAEIYQEVVV